MTAAGTRPDRGSAPGSPGSRNACAITLAVVTPTRRPVNMPGPIADRDRRRAGAASTPVCSHSERIAGREQLGVATGAAAAIGAGPTAARRARRRRDRARRRHARRRGVDREQQHSGVCTIASRASGRRRAAVRAPPRRIGDAPRHDTSSGSTSGIVVAVVDARRARAGRRADRPAAARATRSPHSTIAIDSPSSSSSNPTSCSSWTWSSRYTSTCTTRATRAHRTPARS